MLFLYEMEITHQERVIVTVIFIDNIHIQYRCAEAMLVNMLYGTLSDLTTGHNCTVVFGCMGNDQLAGLYFSPSRF